MTWIRPPDPDSLDSIARRFPRPMSTDFVLRAATPADAPAIAALIERSVHGLSAGDYSRAQRERAIGQVFLVDHGLIADGSYFLAEAPDGRLAGAGGWSDRRALHGGHVRGDTGERIDPAREPARIRAYFIGPDFARRGVGSILLKACEAAAQAAGFSSASLGATLTGVAFYARHGYVETTREDLQLPGGEALTIVHMSRLLA